ncbi:hypothetical protein ACFQE1_01260 [Halobium palmae]|uniref:Secreted peptide n=1 Tax=Halobium palmae TaxID=1776492 RepID=A0ABD5RUF1_9EURY
MRLVAAVFIAIIVTRRTRTVIVRLATMVVGYLVVSVVRFRGRVRLLTTGVVMGVLVRLWCVCRR